MAADGDFSDRSEPSAAAERAGTGRGALEELKRIVSERKLRR